MGRRLRRRYTSSAEDQSWSASRDREEVSPAGDASDIGITVLSLKMWKMLYVVTLVGVFLQAINGQKWDIKKMEECPCAKNVIDVFVASFDKNEAEDFNGQKLRLSLQQSNNDKCTARVLDKSPKPGEIEIRMVYRGSVYTEEQDEGEVQQQGVVDIGQEQGRGDIGPQQEEDIEQEQAGEYIEPQQEDIGQEQAAEDIELQLEEDIGQEEADEDLEQLLGSVAIEQMKESMATGQLQQNPDLGQEQAGVDVAQEQSEQSNDSYLETGVDKKDYTAQYAFTLDVNTGVLSEPADSRRGAQRRKRELMPFETVKIKMEINFEKPAPDAANEKIRSLLKKGLADYWLATAFCLLYVEELNTENQVSPK